MVEREGAIKFQLQYAEAAPLPADLLAELNAWRKIMFLTELIGQEPQRYGGYGYGNISQRLDSARSRDRQAFFVISGTQTGHIRNLDRGHYATVLKCIPEQNLIVAEGPIRPSSESLTHSTLYALDSTIRCVIHAHSPHIWRHAAHLGIPHTRAAVPYGTPAMAEETERLYRDSDVRDRKVFAMGGHTDRGHHLRLNPAGSRDCDASHPGARLPTRCRLTIESKINE